ncbi:MAG TPA: hypothetical protein ENK44_04765, partial [Caldithrix abyssi]|nr:hypothetical protein [Caldithrix abyssi]
MGKKDRVFFDDKHHLNDEGIAICADALQLGKEDDLPQKVKSHLSECNACKQDLVNFYSIIENINQSSAEEHPFFSTNPQNKD